MIINPQQIKKKNVFWNNLCIIVCIFSVINFATAIYFDLSPQKKICYSSLRDNPLIGPINITDKSAVYKIRAKFSGYNSYVYLSGEVLDKNKDTLYEFGKDLWHESGYDSEGSWSESDNYMDAYLTFSEKGTYYIQFFAEDNNFENISITITLLRGSSVAHYQAGVILLLLMIIIGYWHNRKWVNEQVNTAVEAFGECMDD